MKITGTTLPTNNSGVPQVEITNHAQIGGGSSDGDLKARTDIADSNSSTFLNCSQEGHLEVNIIGRDNAGDGSLHNVKVNDNGEVFTQLRPNHFTTLPTLTNGQGHGLLFDNKARLLTKSTLSGLSNIADETTGVNVRVNSIGEVATTSHMKGTDSTNTERDVKCDSTGELIVQDSKITVGNGDLSSGSLQQVLMYGKDSAGTLRPLDTTTQGRQIVDVIELNASGKITASTALSSVQMCGYREDTGNTFHTFKVSNDGTQYVKDETLNNSWTTDITNNIKGDVDSINTSIATLDAKISKGQDDITDGNGKQQVLNYGKQSGGTLKPLSLDGNGYLNINLNDISSSITTALTTKQDITRGTITISAPFGSGNLSSAIDIGDKKTLNFYVDGMANTHTGLIVLGSNDDSNYVPLELFTPQTVGANDFVGGSISKGFRYYKIENGGSSFTASNKIYNAYD